MMLIGVVAAAKKNEKRWIQMTLTGGAPKGATDWLKPGTVIEPSTIHLGTAQEFEDSGWKIPTFLEEKMNNICVILFPSDTTKRPLLIHQKTAVVHVLMWLKQITYTEDQDGPIEIIHTDETWQLKFTRNAKKQFDPYKMVANDISEGGA